MKKTSTLLLGIAIALLGFHAGYCQKSFEGVVTFNIEYGEFPGGTAEMKNMLPKEMKVSLKDKKSRIDQLMGDSGNKNVVVYDYENKVAFVAMDMMGQKMLINVDEESFNENIEKSKNTKVEYFEEYRDILGYKCQKAIITSEGNSMTIFFTEKIPNYMNQEMMNLKGFPIQYEMKQNGVDIKMTATKIDKSSVSDAIFAKPTGYNEMNVKDFQNMTGQDFKF